MMPLDEQFELQQVTGVSWVIVDHRYRVSGARHVVAHIWRVSDEVYEVTWLTDVALPSRYVSPSSVVDDLRRENSRRTRPIPIPHFAPPAH